MNEDDEPNCTELKDDSTKCPECLVNVLQSELDMFGGLCEECTVFHE